MWCRRDWACQIIERCRRKQCMDILAPNSNIVSFGRREWASRFEVLQCIYSVPQMVCFRCVLLLIWDGIQVCGAMRSRCESCYCHQLLYGGCGCIGFSDVLRDILFGKWSHDRSVDMLYWMVSDYPISRTRGQPCYTYHLLGGLVLYSRLIHG